jgi:hypothetical protein
LDNSNKGSKISTLVGHYVRVGRAGDLDEAFSRRRERHVGNNGSNVSSPAI